MNKRMFILFLISFLLYIGPVKAAPPTGASDLTFNQCNEFVVGQGYQNIKGSYYYKYCYRATCSYGSYKNLNMDWNSGYVCANGNPNPYREITSDGCAKYTGTCTNNKTTYCTKVELVDCDRKANGQAFTTTTKKPTTKPTTTTTSKTKTTSKTTSTKSTKKTSSRKTSSTKKTSSSTSSTTSSTTTSSTTKRLANLKIKMLTVNGQNIDVASDSDAYDVSLPYGVSDVSVDVVLEDTTSTYNVTGNNQMPDTDHNIEITITGYDKSERKVILHVKRYQVQSSNCKLVNITVKNYSLKFDKDKFEYTVRVPKELTELNIQVELDEKDPMTYIINGNKNLKNKSKVEIAVSAEDGTVCRYYIRVKKASDVWKYLLIILLLLLLLAGCVGVYIYTKRAKGKYRYE